MPELPEVETIVRTLQPHLTGRRISGVRVLRRDVILPTDCDLPKRLTGLDIANITRRGKKIIFQLPDAQSFYIHLGMSGRLNLEPHNAPVKSHTHVVLQFKDQELRFVDPRRFGGVFWMNKGDSPDAGMGPEPLTLRSAQLGERLSKTTRAIKNALLDQSLIAGLGNIYVDEALFESGIHPLWPANALTKTQVAKLTRAIKRVLNLALRHRGSTLRDYRDANGQAGDFQKLHRVYGRTGKSCSLCKTPIERLVIGGRSSHICPICQPKGTSAS